MVEDQSLAGRRRDEAVMSNVSHSRQLTLSVIRQLGRKQTERKDRGKNREKEGRGKEGQREGRGKEGRTEEGRTEGRKEGRTWEGRGKDGQTEGPRKDDGRTDNRTDRLFGDACVYVYTHSCCY